MLNTVSKFKCISLCQCMPWYLSVCLCVCLLAVSVYEVCTGTRCSTLCQSSNVILCVSACLGVCLFVCVFVCSPCLCMRCAQEQDAPHGVDASGSSQSSALCPGAPVHMALQCKLQSKSVVLLCLLRPVFTGQVLYLCAKSGLKSTSLEEPDYPVPGKWIIKKLHI